MTAQAQVKKLLAVMSPAELAALIGTSMASIYYWRRGAKEPIPAFRNRLAQLYKQRFDSDKKGVSR